MLQHQIDNRRVRFRDASWLSNTLPIITIGGVGGIGSWLAFFLGRIGTPLILYDMDNIDETNFGGQLYSTKHIGMSKTLATIDIIQQFSDFNNVSAYGRFEPGDFVTPVTVTCFDNMLSRKLMFEAWKKIENKELFIDGRMLAESFQIYCVTPDKIEEYEKTLFDDSEVPDLACSFKATSHCGAMISSNITGLITNYLTNKNKKIDIRNLPFNINMEISLMKYDTITTNF